MVAPFLCGYRALGNDYASMASVASSSSIHSTAWKVNSKKSGHLIGPNLFKSPDLYAPPQHVDPLHSAWWASEAILAALGGRSMHDPASELPRIPLPRTPVNKGERKGRS